MDRLRRSDIQQVANCIRLYQFFGSANKDLAGPIKIDETQDSVLKELDFDGFGVAGHAGTVFP